jgi:hypothetical protein
MNDLLKIVADYADQLAAADELAQHDSMTVAEALEALYEAREWVPEFLEVKPQPKRSSNRWKEDSRSRFSQWVAWSLQEQGRRPLHGSRTYRLLDAAEIARRIPNVANGEIREEGKIRSLNWLRKNGYEDRIPEVWRLAVAIAGSADKVTGKYIAEAVNHWKKEALGPRGVKTAIKASKAKTLRLRALTEVRALVTLGTPEAQEEYKALLHDIKELVAEKQREMAA